MPPPARWEEYQPLGIVIPGTKFIAFKVPLKQEICRNLPKNERFSPEQLVQSIKDCGKSLGLIVDLTFTRKYYNAKSFTHSEIQYEKIFTKGHEVPSDDVFQSFADIVDDFTSKNADEDVLIGVHCTHGVNRTGYLICRYMIEKLNIDPEEAISLFNKSRGHPIEREAYISDLKNRSKSGKGTPPGEKGSSGSKDRPYSERSPVARTQIQKNQGCKEPPYKEYFSGQQRDHQSWGQGRINPYSRLPSQPDWSEALVCRGQRGSGGYPFNQYMSPLDRLEAPPQSGWGSAARSGWGSSDSQERRFRGGEQNSYRSKNRNRFDPYLDPRRGYHNRGQQYSWRRSDSANPGAVGHAGGNYRDRAEDLQGCSGHGETWNHRPRHFQGRQKDTRWSS